MAIGDADISPEDIVDIVGDMMGVPGESIDMKG